MVLGSQTLSSNVPMVQLSIYSPDIEPAHPRSLKLRTPARSSKEISLSASQVLRQCQSICQIIHTMRASRALQAPLKAVDAIIRPTATASRTAWMCRRCVSTAALRSAPSTSTQQWPLDRRFQQGRGAATAAAMQVSQIEGRSYC